MPKRITLSCSRCWWLWAWTGKTIHGIPKKPCCHRHPFQIVYNKFSMLLRSNIKFVQPLRHSRHEEFSAESSSFGYVKFTQDYLKDGYPSQVQNVQYFNLIWRKSVTQWRGTLLHRKTGIRIRQPINKDPAWTSKTATTSASSFIVHLNLVEQDNLEGIYLNLQNPYIIYKDSRK